MRLTRTLLVTLFGLLLIAGACSAPAVKRLEGSPAVVVPPGALGRSVPLRPAAFVTKDLTTSTVECNLGADVWVGVTVTNTGGQAGTYPVILKIDDAVARTANVTLNAGTSQKVWFILNQAKDLPDIVPTYEVSVDELYQVLVVL